jgi:hypothetical protein
MRSFHFETFAIRQVENRSGGSYCNRVAEDLKIVASLQPRLIDLAFPLPDNRADSGCIRDAFGSTFADFQPLTILPPLLSDASECPTPPTAKCTP